MVEEIPPEQEELDSLVVLASFSPAVADPGGSVRFVVEIINQGSNSYENLVFEDSLEDGFIFIKPFGSNVVYDKETGKVIARIESIEPGDSVKIQYLLRLQKEDIAVSGEMRIHQVVVLDEKNEILAQESASLWVGPIEQGWESVQVVAPGSWVSMGRVSLQFDERESRSSIAAVLSEVSRTEGGPDFQFEVSLFETEMISVDNERLPNEQRTQIRPSNQVEPELPVNMEVDFSEIAAIDNLPPGKSPYIATYDEEAEVWVKVPIETIDYQRNTARVQAAHFSTWGAGIGYDLPQNGANVLLFDEPYVSLFTGRARNSYSIWTPSGRNGMTPDVTLSYSSGTVDGVLGDVQAPWVGIGWNIDGIEIVRKITTDENGYGYEDAFTLSFNGVKYVLVENDETPGRYHTQDETFLYIQRHNPALGNAGDVSNITSEWWEVVSQNGTRYRLGWNEDSEQVSLMDGYACTYGNPCTTPNGAYASLGYAGLGVDVVALRWRVDRILDTHDNFITYSYYEEQQATGFAVFDNASYIGNIEFTGHYNNQGQIDIQPGYSVEFVRGQRIGDMPGEDLEIWDNHDAYILDKIQVCYESCTSGILLRTYNLDYVVRSVPSVDGTMTLAQMSESGGGFSDQIAIPATTAADIRFSYTDKPNIDEGCAECDQWQYPRLTGIQNGYGAEIKFSYERDDRGEDYFYHYMVSQIDYLEDSNTAGITGFTYENPAYEGEGEDPVAGELFGYEDVLETTYDFDGSTKIQDTAYHFLVDFPFIGKGEWTEWRNPSGTVLSKSANIWGGSVYNLPDGVYNTYLSESAEYVDNGGSLTLTSRSVYSYDSSTGNLTDELVYKGSSLARKFQYEYEINMDPDTWILNLVSREVIRTENHTIVADTRYIYDEGVTPISTGELTRSQNLVNGIDQSVDSEFIYDDYGNITETRVYESYGTAGSNPTGDYVSSSVAYEDDLYTYPISQTNALDEITTVDYILSLGFPFVQTDSNGWVTSLAYDGLGRLISSTSPGFSQPSLRFVYPVPNNGEVSSPYTVRMDILDTLSSGSPQYRHVYGIYDGLGRMLQNQVLDSSSGQLYLSEASYDAAGQIERESEVHVESGSAGDYITPQWAQLDITEYEYDALGRVTQITQPGDFVSELSYSGLTTEVIDANGHKTTQQVDGLGRLVSVHEYMGVNPSWTEYSTNTYTYDSLDRLIKVIDDKNNQTVISYDWLGRKVSMDDPDMGYWSYE